MKKLLLTIRDWKIARQVQLATSNGFTLIELLIAITIFVSFLVVVANSYIAIVRAQVTANETRQMYSEMRNFVDFVNGEMRDGSIDYYCYEPPLLLGNLDSNSDALTRCAGTTDIAKGDNLRTVSRDGLLASVISFDSKNMQVLVQKFRKTADTWQAEIGYEKPEPFAFSNLQVKDLHFEIYPKKNPAMIDNKNLQNQLQPMVMMTMKVASNNSSVKFDLNFQTMITSRTL